jgi:hypothetical protein
MNRIITYAIENDSGLVISRVGSEVAWPVLEYDKMLPANNFTAGYHLERFPVSSLGSNWRNLKWTKKIPTYLKNRHREFWSFKPIKVK